MFNIYCGSKETMERVANRGVLALNPKTHKWQHVNKNAVLKVVVTQTLETGEILADLVSDIDLRAEAKEKGLIL
jgi:hypothetical protein